MATEDTAHRMVVDEPVPSGDGQHYESFLWRLRMAEDGTVSDASVQHVATGEIQHWPAWDPEAMLSFVTSRSTKDIRVAKEARAAEEAHALGETRQAAQAARAGTAPAAGLRRDSPPVLAGTRFGLTLTLDFGAGGGAPYRMVYDLVVVARRLDGDVHEAVVRDNGVLEMSSSSIRVEAEGLPAGIYRLDAAVTLSKPSIGLQGQTALVEGVLMTVLPR